MSVFLTPQLQPFFGATYFPPTDSRGQPGFTSVLKRIASVWQERHEEVIAQVPHPQPWRPVQTMKNFMKICQGSQGLRCAGVPKTPMQPLLHDFVYES